MFGIRHFTAIINPPQGAILAVGEIYQGPQAEGERIVARAQMQLSLVVDHRILDGADAARFLVRLRELLQDPGWMAGG
jgi:pyruvate dehydrogenase E2 component (dihydrolipoamide acetyltransferase)